MDVVDLGCADYGPVSSMGSLVDRFHPKRLYGFDPSPKLKQLSFPGVTVTVERVAAWTHDGFVKYLNTWGSDSRIDDEGAWTPCFNFSRWLRLHGKPAVVKMDIEGAEIPILRKMHEEGTDELMTELIVEWHVDADLPPLRCPVSEWWM